MYSRFSFYAVAFKLIGFLFVAAALWLAAATCLSRVFISAFASAALAWLSLVMTSVVFFFLATVAEFLARVAGQMQADEAAVGGEA
jgi:hypothetical protein